MGNDREERVIAERLPDLGEWEFYLFSLEDSGDAVCKVALRGSSTDSVEYGVFRGEDGEPSATGAIAPPGRWSDEAREDALKEIMTIYGDNLPELRGGVLFDFYSERELDEGDAGEEDEEDSQEEDDSNDDDDEDDDDDDDDDA